ncbi:MAG TPA: Gfo/Idh/MocA family oxidoreductase [Nitrospira sp.]|nr:Gfo/Idh/MocA family oxidoreductase [Nitrospira sp.]
MILQKAMALMKDVLMKTPRLGFGIVGTGMIARVIADAIDASANARLVAVSSRKIGGAQRFVAARPGASAVQGHGDLLGRSDVAAVYVATPTAPKEDIALAAIAAGKHVLVDKPFVSHASLLRMTKAAAAKGVAFMDATHFVHHSRTAAIKKAIPDKIGAPRSLHTTFYFPFSDRTNIRFDVEMEPMGALGDMAWYSMRAVVEYLRPQGTVTKAVTVVERDSKTTAVVRASGLIAFEGGEVSTFDVGYTAGTALMDLQLLGTKGVIAMDDFVLDWTDSFAFKNPDIRTGYTYRTGTATRKDLLFVSTPSDTPAQVAMIEAFAELAASGNADRRAEFAAASLETQAYLDAIWTAARS